jgi:hypothetical protein
MSLSLFTAEKLARKIAAEISPFCDQDLVVLPKPGLRPARRQAGS